MRILIAAKHTRYGDLPIGGVQTWSNTLEAVFKRAGHEVELWDPCLDIHGEFDLGIFSNLRYTYPAIRRCHNVVKVSHGIIPDEKGASDFFGTSEEVVDRWHCGLGVLRQPIDTEFWAPKAEPVAKKYLVRHSYRRGLGYLESIAPDCGLEYRHIQEDSPYKIREILQQAAVVIATGRAALEAASCGACIVVADHREYQGPLLDVDFVDSMRRNYSGRGGVEPNQSLMTKAIELSLSDGSKRDHVLAYHRAERIAEKLLKCCTY